MRMPPGGGLDAQPIDLPDLRFEDGGEDTERRVAGVADREHFFDKEFFFCLEKGFFFI